MGFNDRGWMREERKRRWRWPYRLRPDLSYWVSECMRASLVFGAIGRLLLAWSHFRG
jgi:hypothetical protein